MNTKDNQEPLLEGWEKAVAIYTAVGTILMLAGLVACFYWIEQLRPNGSAQPSDPTVLPIHLLITLMLVSGAIGGYLFNIHSLIKHVSRGDFERKHSLGYYFNPISGAVCGFIVIVLCLGGVLTLGLGEMAGEMALQHSGRLMPFVGIAVIAGYGSRQFKLKLDELAETLFRTSKSDQEERDKAQAKANKANARTGKR